MKMTELEEMQHGTLVATAKYLERAYEDKPRETSLICDTLAAYDAKKAAPEPTCKWTQGEKGWWDAGCKKFSTRIRRVAAETHCPCCGLPIEPVPYVEPEEETP